MEKMNAEDWRIADQHIREIIDIELKHRDNALARQAREYERRLESLNHENQRILEAGQRSVSVEKFEGWTAGQEAHNRQTREFIATTQSRNETIIREQAKLRVVIIAWITVASFALALGAALGFPNLIP